MNAQPWREIALVEATHPGGSGSRQSLAQARRRGRVSETLVLVTLRDGHWGFQQSPRSNSEGRAGHPYSSSWLFTELPDAAR